MTPGGTVYPMTGIYQVIVEPDPLIVPEKESTRMLVRILVNFMAKAVHLFVDMDKMIGGNFEKGLADMNAVVESAAHVDSGSRRSIH